MSGHGLLALGWIVVCVSAGAWSSDSPWWWQYLCTAGIVAGLACTFIAGRRVERASLLTEGEKT